MKSYKEVAESVFERRDKYLAEKMRKRAVIRRRAVIGLSFCIVVLAGLGIWNNDKIKKAFEAYRHGGESEIIIDVSEPTVTEKVTAPTESYTTATEFFVSSTDIETEFSTTSPPETTAVSQSGTSEHTTAISSISAIKTEIKIVTTAEFTIETQPTTPIFQTVSHTTVKTGGSIQVTTAVSEGGMPTTTITEARTESIQTTKIPYTTPSVTIPSVYTTTRPPRTTTMPPFTYTLTATTTDYPIWATTTATTTDYPIWTTTNATTTDYPIWITTTSTTTYYPIWTTTTSTTTYYPIWTTTTATTTDYPIWTTTTAKTTNYSLWTTTTAKTTNYPLWTTTTATTIYYPLWTTTNATWIDEYILTTAFLDIEYYLTTTTAYYDNYIF